MKYMYYVFANSTVKEKKLIIIAYSKIFLNMFKYVNNE